MHINKITLRNYRNFLNTSLIFKKGINTVIGENGTGKTNIFRAIRLLLDETLPRRAIKLSEADFCRHLGDWRGHWIIISIEFEEIANDEASQALFVHGTGILDGEPIERATDNLIFRPKAHIRQQLGQILDESNETLDEIRSAIQIEDYEAILTGKSNVDFADDDVYSSIVGDFENAIFPQRVSSNDIGSPLPQVLSLSSEVSLTFIKALRDVVSDFKNYRTNPLLRLLQLRSKDIDNDEFEPIVNTVETLNSSIEELSDVTNIRKDIKSTLSEALGDTYSPASLSIKSGLSSAAEELFQSLKLFVDESENGHEGGIHEMSLGGANLIFLTLKLLEFKYQKPEETIANFLLIEEPEAHIHTHIQKTLFDKIDYENTQIIYSTHSSYISEVSHIKRSNILSKTTRGCVAFQPAHGLSDPEITFVERYLDSIRSNLLFAKSIILVEGDAEEILIPVMIKKVLGISIDELGITIINMRSTGFKNIALLFHDQRIRKKCSIITDLDSAFFDTTIVPNDNETIRKNKVKATNSEKKGAERKDLLDTFCNNNQWLSPFYADHTFEVDFVKNSNHEYVIATLNEVYSQEITIKQATDDLRSGIIDNSGQRVLTIASNQGKGWFAITLSSKIDFNVKIPDYILDAVIFAHGTFNEDQLQKIIFYRFGELKKFINQVRSTHAYSNVEWNNYLLPLESGINRLEPVLESYKLGKGLNILG